MYIKASVALAFDTFATLMCQTGYLIQKRGHQSVEAHNTNVSDPKDRKNGYLTWKWIVGITISVLAGFIHACKSLCFFLGAIFTANLVSCFPRQR